MANIELPPRRPRGKQDETIARNRTTLDVLLQMGFTRNRAEKALAATGDKGVQLASDWLLSHADDPTLDHTSPRDYILYLCPVGQFQQELLQYWQKTYMLCGWNRAHNYFPHVTLCSFFKADDNLVSSLSHALRTVGEKVLKSSPKELPLEYFSSVNFIGMFVGEACAAFLKDTTNLFSAEVKRFGVNVESHKKQLHISLAYQFQTELKEQLENLAKTIPMSSVVRWDLRLYSRDPGIANCQVRKVINYHGPRAPDELELIKNDFVFLSEDEIKKSNDGWYKGTSWLTGRSGLFPGVYTERTAESETWTMHRSVPIIGVDLKMAPELDPPLVEPKDAANRTSQHAYENLIGTCSNMRAMAYGGARPKTRAPAPANSHSLSSPQMARKNNGGGHAPLSSNCDSGEPRHLSPERALNVRDCSTSMTLKPTDSSEHLYQGLHKDTNSGGVQNKAVGHAPLMTSSAYESKPMAGRTPRQLYVIRHGERIDFTFGKDWVANCFDSHGNYIRTDLNLPTSLPKRTGGAQNYVKDSPLSLQGHFQARVIGEALQEKHVPVSHVYCSPSLRCVETATGILEGLGIERKIRVEPGLFEWIGWYKAGLPKFISLKELQESSFPVDESNTPIWPISRLNMSETIEQYYDRSHQVTTEILNRHGESGGNVMLIAHAGSLDVCTRKLVGQPARSHAAFHEVLHKIPYCAMAVFQEDCVIRDKWHLIEPPILPFSHTNNPKYNWTVLLGSGNVTG